MWKSIWHFKSCTPNSYQTLSRDFSYGDKYVFYFTLRAKSVEVTWFFCALYRTFLDKTLIYMIEIERMDLFSDSSAFIEYIVICWRNRSCQTTKKTLFSYSNNIGSSSDMIFKYRKNISEIMGISGIFNCEKYSNDMWTSWIRQGKTKSLLHRAI